MNNPEYVHFLITLLACLVGFVFRDFVTAFFGGMGESAFARLLVKVGPRQATIEVTLPELHPEQSKSHLTQIINHHAHLLQGRLLPCLVCGWVGGHLPDEDGDPCPLDFEAEAFLCHEADCTEHEEDEMAGEVEKRRPN